MLEQELGSIIRFCMNHYPEATVITKRLPQNMSAEALYFPPPITDSTPFAGGVYIHQHMLTIKVISPESPQAYQKAAGIADAMFKARGAIPRLNADGSDSGKKMKIKNANIRELADGQVQLTIQFESKHMYLGIEYDKIGEVNTTLA